MLGHGGWEQKLGSDFKVLGVVEGELGMTRKHLQRWTSGNALVRERLDFYSASIMHHTGVQVDSNSLAMLCSLSKR